MNTKSITFIVGAIILVFGAFMLMGKLNMTATENEPTMEETVEMDTSEDSISEDEEVLEVTVEGKNFVYTPSVLTAKKGQKVRVTFKNVGGFHDFVIDELDVATARINTGEEAVVEFTADEIGDFAFYCSVPGHRDAGMEGILTVTE